MADQIYNASLIEALWEKIVPDGYVLMEGGRHPTKLIRLKDDIVGLAFQFPKTSVWERSPLWVFPWNLKMKGIAKS